VGLNSLLFLLLLLLLRSSSPEAHRLALTLVPEFKNFKVHFFSLRGKKPLFFLPNIMESLEIKMEIDEILKTLEESQKVLVERKFVLEDPPSEEDSGWFVTVDGFLKLVYLFANAEKQIFFTIQLQRFFVGESIIQISHSFDEHFTLLTVKHLKRVQKLTKMKKVQSTCPQRKRRNRLKLMMTSFNSLKRESK
jgi:hypothetical protein